MSKQASEKIYQCPTEEVIVPEERQRKSFNPQKLRDLADSFKQYGQIQPGVCRKDGERIILVAGERRLRAAQLAEIPYSYILRTNAHSEDFFLEIELEENLCREDLSWAEEVNAKQKLHELYQAREGKTKLGAKGGHTIRDTARILNESKTTLRDDLELAAFADQIPDVANAPTKSEAKKLIKRFKEEMIRDVALEKTLSGDESMSHVYSSPNEPTKENVEGQLKARLDRYDERCLLGDFTKLLEGQPDNHFDLVFFDPPWGVDFDSVKRTSAEKKVYTDNAEDFSRDFPKWIELLWSKMSENSILYLFFGIANFAYIYELVEKTGFTTNRMPLIWHKKGAHHTRNPKIWPGRSYEPIAYCRKGSKDLQISGASDLIQTAAPTPKMKSVHPSAKHPDIYRELFRRTAYPGDKVLDPMCGSGMAAVAAESLISTIPTEWLMIDKDKDYRTLTLTNLMKGYSTIVGDPLDQSDSEVIDSREMLQNILLEKWGDTSFRDLEPGGEKWMDYWNDFPDQQKSMLKWKSKT